MQMQGRKKKQMSNCSTHHKHEHRELACSSSSCYFNGICICMHGRLTVRRMKKVSNAQTADLAGHRGRRQGSK